jgi:hypothetical protein
MRFFPFEAESITTDQLEALSTDEAVTRVAFTLGTPVMPVAAANEFIDRNPDSMRLDIGRKSAKGLRESCLVARSSDPDALTVWKRIASELKAVTVAGATAVDPKTGASVRLRNHRFTKGAKELEAQGVDILPVGGTCILRLG